MGSGISGTHVAVPAQIAVQPFSHEWPKRTGAYYYSGLLALDTDELIDGGLTIIAGGEIQYVPFILAQRTTFTALAGNIILEQAGGLMNFGIYASNAACVPTSLIRAANSVDMSAAGMFMVDWSATPLTLDAGLYWIASQSNKPVATPIHLGVSACAFALLGADDPFTAPYTGWVQAAAWANLPAVAAATNGDNASCRCGLLVA